MNCSHVPCRVLRKPSVRGALIVSGVVAMALAFTARAEFPERTIRMVVPYTPGGPASLLGRFVGQKLQQATGQPVIIENKPGAGLAVGAQFVANSPADGYTLFLGASSMLVPGSAGGRTPADNLRDLRAVSLVGGFPLILVTGSQFDAKTVPELIALARQRPGQVNYGSSGNGSLTHLAAALFALQAGVDMVHVPFRGINEAATDLAAGRVQLAFVGAPTVPPLVAGGRIRALAVTSLQRSAAAPQLPSIAEAALPGYEVIPWYGIMVPTATPPAIVTRLHREIVRIMQSGEAREQWKEWGADPTFSKSPEEFTALMQKEAAKWAAFIKQTGIETN